ncbi:MAG TPA: hypothetical protein DD440_07235 [Porticoccaceae bacterium]|nr:hypothetical protein [Porticoccaceae bacterium]
MKGSLCLNFDMLLNGLPLLMALVTTGIVAGLIAGLLGVGGGLVIVPVLYWVFQSVGVDAAAAILMATGTSLTTIIFTSIASARAHYRYGNVDVPLFRRWAVPMLFGVVIGGWVSTRVDGSVLTGLFGSVASLIALNRLFRPNTTVVWDQLPSVVVQSGLAAVIGLTSVMMGVGAGTLGVAIMTSYNMQVHRAVGTAALFGCVIALPGAIMMLLNSGSPADSLVGTVGFVSIPGVLVIVPMTTLFAPVGVRLGSQLNAQKLQKIFAIFLMLIGAAMLWSTIAE